MSKLWLETKFLVFFLRHCICVIFVAVIAEPWVTFFNQLIVLIILHITTKCRNYITVASASNLVAEYLSTVKKWNQQAVQVATQYASALCKLTISSYLFAKWHPFRHVGYLRHQQQDDLWPFDLESCDRVMCDVGYLYVNFSLPRPLYSQIWPYVHDRHTDVRQHHRYMPPPIRGGGIINVFAVFSKSCQMQLRGVINSPRIIYVDAERVWRSDVLPRCPVSTTTWNCLLRKWRRFTTSCHFWW